MATLARPGQPDRHVALQRRDIAELLAEELRRLDPDEIYGESLAARGRDSRNDRIDATKIHSCPRSQASSRTTSFSAAPTRSPSRMAEELTARYGLAVTAIVPSAASGHGAADGGDAGGARPRAAELTADAFLDAGLPARARAGDPASG